MTRGVQISPVGPQVAVAWAPRSNPSSEILISTSLSWFPQTAANRVTPVSSGGRSDPDGSLVLGQVGIAFTTAVGTLARLTGGAGDAMMLSSPRGGRKSSPFVAGGVSRRIHRGSEVSIGYDQFLMPLGETRFTVPITLTFSF